MSTDKAANKGSQLTLWAPFRCGLASPVYPTTPLLPKAQLLPALAISINKVGIIMKYLLICLVVFLASCASTKLVTGAEKVRFTKSNPDEQQYVYLGDVSCSYPGSFSSVSEIIKSCRNDLRNQAAEMSGVLVFIENEQMGSGQCLKCITMVGSAYKKAIQ